MTVVVMNAWQVFIKGGPMMWPLLVLSVVAMAIGINRLMVLAAVERRLLTEKQALLASLRQGQLKETLRLCETHPGLLARILKSGLLKFGSSRDLIKGMMEETFGYEFERLTQHMNTLGIIVNIAPLLGLLGTINAMTVVFHAVQIRSNALSPLTAAELASGIWQALLTTAAGLVVAIFSYTIYGFCAARINLVASYLNRSMTEMTNVLQQIAELQSGQEEPV